MTHTVFEGYMPYAGFQTYYSIVGDGNKTPIITLHGGPGAGSDYLHSLDALAQDGRKLVFYDQIGCGKSPAKLKPDRWTIDFFVEELHTLVQTLGFSEFYLMGQSWGTILAVSFAHKYPDGLRGLILANCIASMPLYDADNRKLAAAMPAPDCDVLLHAIDSLDESAPAFGEAFAHFFYEHYIHHVEMSFDDDGSENEVGRIMEGPYELVTTGILKDVDLTEQLRGISAPVLAIRGEFDMVSEMQLALFKDNLPNLKRAVTIAGSGHIPNADAPDELNRLIQEFLSEIEA